MGQIKYCKLHIVTAIKYQATLHESHNNSKMPSAKKAADPNKLKRPLNAYMMFANEKRPELQKKHPELKITEIAKMIGEEWRSMSDDEKSPYTREEKICLRVMDFDLIRGTTVMNQSPIERACSF